jgi:hypothetical protein
MFHCFPPLKEPAYPFQGLAGIGSMSPDLKACPRSGRKQDDIQNTLGIGCLLLVGQLNAAGEPLRLLSDLASQTKMQPLTVFDADISRHALSHAFPPSGRLSNTSKRLGRLIQNDVRRGEA